MAVLAPADADRLDARDRSHLKKRRSIITPRRRPTRAQARRRSSWPSSPARASALRVRKPRSRSWRLLAESAGGARGRHRPPGAQAAGPRHPDRPGQGRGGGARWPPSARPTSWSSTTSCRRPAAQPRGGSWAQDPRPHAAHPRHLRPARAHPRRPPAGGAGPARLHAAAPDRQGRDALAAGRRHRDPRARARPSWRPTAGASASASRPSSARSRACAATGTTRREARQRAAAPVVALVGLHQRGQVHALQRPHRARDTAVSDQLFMTLDPLVRKMRAGRRARRAAGRHRRLHPEAAPRAGGRLPGHARGGGRGRPAAARDGRLRGGRRGARGGGGGGAEGDRGRRAAAHRRAQQGRPHRRRRAARAPAGGAAGVGRRLRADRRGAGRPRRRRGAAGWSCSRAACGCASRPRDRRGIAGVYTAGRVVSHEVEGGRGHASTPSCPSAWSSGTGSTSYERAAPGWPPWPSLGRASPRLRDRAGAPGDHRPRPRSSSSRAGRRARCARGKRRAIERAWHEVLAGDTAAAPRSGSARCCATAPG